MTEHSQLTDPAVTEIARRLRVMRYATGVPSLRLIAERAGCGFSAVGDLLNGRRTPKWSTLSAIVTALGGDPGEFKTLHEAAQAQWEAAKAAAIVEGRQRRAQWEALATEPLTGLPREALEATVRDLAGELLACHHRQDL